MNTSATSIEIPLFPLNAVLFPGGYLPLRIFEPRYLDMISRTLKDGSGIGVVLIDDGVEVGDAARPHDVGTLSEISYWHKRNDGLLGITLFGKQRFRVLSTEVQPDQLIVAQVELLDNSQTQSLPDTHQSLVLILQNIIEHLEPPFTTMTTYYDDLDWVSSRLIELLPISLDQKQLMLKLDSLEQRVSSLDTLLGNMKLN